MKKHIKEVVEDLGPYFFDCSVDELIEKLKPFSGMTIEVEQRYDTVDTLLINLREETDEEYQERLDKERKEEERELKRARERAKKAAEKEKKLLEKLKAKYE